MNFKENKLNTDNLESELIAQEPPLYQIVLHNDDFTPMEFVVSILEKFFDMDRSKAADITIQAHIKGKAGWGRYSRDFAESKIAQVIDYARDNQHPLNCSMETAV